LKKWVKEEFLYSLKKLSEWEKQLIINSKHQDDVMGKIDNYGQLLFILGEFRRGSIYWSRMLKRIQRDSCRGSSLEKELMSYSKVTKKPRIDL
jgi:hypothetical protein